MHIRIAPGRAWALSAALFLLAACGGGDGAEATTPPIAPTAVVVPSVVSYELAATRDGPDGAITAPVDYAQFNYVGDFAGDLIVRSFFRFDTSFIPDGATIVSATLWMHQSEVLGTPYGADGLGELLVDHVRLGTAVDAGDFGDAGVMHLGFGALVTDPVPGWKSLDVTNQVQADVDASRPSTDFRLRFTLMTDLDDQADLVGLANSDGFAINQLAPYVEVVYRTP